MGAQRGRDNHDRASVASAPVVSADPRGPMVPRLRRGTIEDAGLAGALHAAGIADGFLAGLGERFLSVLYGRIALDVDSFLLVAEDADAVPLGFIAGSGGVGRLYRSFLLHDGLRAAAAAPIRLARSWRRALETLRYGSAGGQDPTTGQGGSEIELLAVAVTAGAQGRGVGAALVGAFLDEVRSRGVARATVVVGADNTAALSMYRRAGFGDEEELELHPGTRSLRLTWTPIPGGLR
jgi:ribosomal protein S18 acetylase RimI-like enzyme